MTQSELLPGLNAIFQEVFDDDSLVPTADMVAADVDGWDSLGHIRLVVATEAEYGIKFSSSEISGWPNVGALVEAIKKRLKDKNG